MKLKDLLYAIGWDEVDTFDKKNDIEVTVSVALKKPENKMNFYDKFIDTVISDLDVIPNDHGSNTIICDWSGFVEKHHNALNNFMVEEFVEDGQYTDHEDFTYEWIGTLDKYLGGAGSEESYKKLIDLLNNEPSQCLTPGFVNFYDEICRCVAEAYLGNQDDMGKDKFPPLTEQEILNDQLPKVINQIYIEKSYPKYIFSDEEIKKNLSLMSKDAYSGIIDAFEEWGLVKVFDIKDIVKPGITTSDKENLAKDDKEKV